MTLQCQWYFEKHLKSVVSPTSDKKGKPHSLFRLTAANDGQLPISKYVTMNANFLGLKVPDVGFLITKKPHLIHEDAWSSWLDLDKTGF